MIRSIRLWSLILRLVLIARVGRVGRTMATFVLLLVRLTKRRRRQPELLLLSCHKRGIRRLNCVPDSLLRSLTLELSSLLLQCHIVEIIILGRLKKHER